MIDFRIGQGPADYALVTFILAWQLFAWPAHAAEPDFALKTKNVEITVTIDKASNSIPASPPIAGPKAKPGPKRCAPAPTAAAMTIPARSATA